MTGTTVWKRPGRKPLLGSVARVLRSRRCRLLRLTWDASAWAHSAGPYATQWAYSKSGTITSITNKIASGPTSSTTEVEALLYPAAGTDGAHGVTGIDTTGDTTPEDTFSYDDAGRQTQRVVDGKTTDLTWDVSSSLVKAVVDPGTTSETVWAYLYDASGQRVAKIQATDTNQDDTLENVSATAYFGDTEVTDANTASTGASDLSADRFFTFGGATVAVVHAEQVASTTLDTQLLYMFGDFQGSAQVMMSDARDVNGDPDPASAVITRNAYTPYGAKRSINTDTSNDDPAVTMDASLDLERGWLSQIADEDPTAGGTGLTYLNARYYDPVASRFISPDPLMNPSDPKTLDPYRYAENNPVFYSDATGLASNCAGLSGDALTYCGSSSSGASDSVCGLYGCSTHGAPGAPKDKNGQSIDDMVKNYQVSDDPKGRDSKFAWEDVNNTESWYVHQLSTQDQSALAVDTELARLLQDLNKTGKTKDGTRANAMQHAAWTAMLASDLGYEKALWLTTLHEGVPGGDAGFMVMDLKNDMVGLEIYLENPDAGKGELVDLVLDAVLDGRTVAFDHKGELNFTDRIVPGTERPWKGKGKYDHSGVGYGTYVGVWLHEIESNYEINETFAKLM